MTFSRWPGWSWRRFDLGALNLARYSSDAREQADGAERPDNLSLVCVCGAYSRPDRGCPALEKEQ